MNTVVVIGLESVKRLTCQGFKAAGIDNDLRRRSFGAEASTLATQRKPIDQIGDRPGISASLQELTGKDRQVAGHEVSFGAKPENRRADLRIFPADCSNLFARTNWRPKFAVTQTVTDIFEPVRAHEKVLGPLV